MASVLLYVILYRVPQGLKKRQKGNQEYSTAIGFKIYA
jgi:hypothetical protein